MWRTRIVLTLMLLSVASRLPASPDEPPPLFCTDVLTIPRSSLLLVWKLRGNPDLLLDGQRVCTAEEPSPGFAKCGWEYELRDVGVVRPEAGTALRLVATHLSHVTGTGTHGTVDALECRGSRIVEVFSAAEALVKVASTTSLVVASRVWLKDDPMCCPSHERHSTFEWDRATHTYLSTGVAYFRRDDQTGKRTRVPKPEDIEF